jgi:hypothetical protein
MSLGLQTGVSKPLTWLGNPLSLELRKSLFLLQAKLFLQVVFVFNFKYFYHVVFLHPMR